MSFDKNVEILFQTLDKKKIAHPHAGILSATLSKNISPQWKKQSAVQIKVIKPEEAALFASAAVEMWQRSVHSFLISVGLYNTSPIWASASGYYASHYCIRGLAHLLGYFQIRKISCIVEMKIEAGKHCCHLIKKNGGDREHIFYWRVVKSNPKFMGNPFFTLNPEDSDLSDSAHRSMANYFDHVNNFPVFHPLNEQEIEDRIDRLSKIELSDVPIPNRQSFPDTQSVQLIAYHRITLFRQALDQILGSKSSYWNRYRTPQWSQKYISFQAISPSYLKNFNFMVSS